MGKRRIHTERTAQPKVGTFRLRLPHTKAQQERSCAKCPSLCYSNSCGIGFDQVDNGRRGYVHEQRR